MSFDFLGCDLPTKKFLILSASIGSGHMRAAQALKQVFENAQIIDFMARDISLINWLTKKFYLTMLRFIPNLYDKIYKFSDGRRIGLSVRFFISLMMYLPFSKLLKNFRPDIIICTHPFPEAAASLWKYLHRKSKTKFLLTTVLTDYSVHKIWVYDEVDIYFVATEEMREELETHSHAEQKIFATGIPICSEFKSLEKNCTSKLTRILIMGGGLGLGSIERTLNELNHVKNKFKIIVVTGCNEKLFSRLLRMQQNFSYELEIFGFVRNIETIMANADLLITKPGALTMTEAFAVGLPLLLHDPIPGPEILNANYAISHGAAIAVGQRKISEIVNELLDDPSLLEVMSKAAKSLAHPLAAEQIKKILAD